MVVVVVAPSTLPTLRKELNALRMRGQRRIHFAKESPSRRRSIAAAIAGMPVAATAFDARGIRDARAARERALRAVVADLDAQSVARLIIEQDDSLVAADRRTLFRATRATRSGLEYLHVRPASEPMLWIPDAIAWSIARGGDSARRIAAVVEANVTVR
ncbi:hypothetical protein FK268_01365 [Tsukamurella sputi]|uniref:Uncharacterized protein n=1 Tax=Tsukamurella sputi TaxID=2591848 RepID=A0A5C5RVY4_9ACTN|nr:hypothetical protein FK268_01365 [Tsukamurella sputi]